MATGMTVAGTAVSRWFATSPADPQEAEPTARAIAGALLVALILVLTTRMPVARPGAFDLDEMGYLDFIKVDAMPPAHTLFLASGRVLGLAVGDAYRGFVLLDMLVSALALTAVWWWLRALVRPATAAAATLLLGLSPIIWSYGAMAGNYTAILLVGSILLGTAWRGHRCPRAWQPYLAAVVLALGAGYRQDIGTLWMPVFLLILWQHRWAHAIQAMALFVLANLAWFLPMLHDVGGWHVYRALNREFAYKAGYLNSVWNLGLIDGPVRYAVKAAIALTLTLGPALLVVPRGLARLRRMPGGGFLALLMFLSMAPALGLHLMIHFGVPGYALHYIPALIALVALGIGRIVPAEAAARTAADDLSRMPVPKSSLMIDYDRAPARLAVLAVALGAFFLFYPTDYRRGGLRGDFDLSFARYTRVGLQTQPPLRVASSWRTMNSEVLPGGRRTTRPRESLGEVFSTPAGIAR